MPRERIRREVWSRPIFVPERLAAFQSFRVLNTFRFVTYKEYNSPDNTASLSLRADGARVPCRVIRAWRNLQNSADKLDTKFPSLSDIVLVGVNKNDYIS